MNEQLPYAVVVRTSLLMVHIPRTCADVRSYQRPITICQNTDVC